MKIACKCCEGKGVVPVACSDCNGNGNNEFSLDDFSPERYFNKKSYKIAAIKELQKQWDEVWDQCEKLTDLLPQHAWKYQNQRDDIFRELNLEALKFFEKPE